MIVNELMKYKKVNPNICDSQNRTAPWLAAKRGAFNFLSILCTPHWVIDTAIKPKDEELLRQFANYLEEYSRDSDQFQRNMVAPSHMSIHIQASDLFHFFFCHLSTSLSLTL